MDAADNPVHVRAWGVVIMIKVIFMCVFVLAGGMLVCALSCILIAALALAVRNFFRRTFERLKGKDAPKDTGHTGNIPHGGIGYE